jgi:hypothetical protein
MSTITFDTLHFANRLKSGGFTDEQAEVLIELPLEIQKAMRNDNLCIENARQQELKAFFAGYKRDLSGFKFNREEANEH